MSTDQEDLALEENFVEDDADDIEEVEDVEDVEDAEESSESPVEVAKSNLTTRRIIDNYLDELRLRKQLGDYDFDL